MAFSYSALTSRNLGFVTEREQARLRQARVFVCGAGGMGGAVLQSLIRTGVEHFAVADPDCFEVSNLNRQVFATLDTVGRRKVDVVREAAARINPGATIATMGGEWVHRVDELMRDHPIVINTMDDVRAGILLYRKAREHGATVIDAYTSPLPSVTVVRPSAPRPEERLDYPTVGRAWQDLSEADAAACIARELAWVLVHSSSHRHVDLARARAFLAGTAPRMSFAPMVVTTGNLMCFEAIKLILGRGPETDERGYFFDPWRARIEWPRGAIASLLGRRAARRLLESLAA